jgi:elongation factor Ts
MEVKGEGALGMYLHSNSKVAALVEVTGFAGAEARELARELAMQVAAVRPPYATRAAVPADVLEKEKEIYREELKAAKKPEAIWEKILTGKLEKFFENNVLVDQVWIKDDKKKVKDLIAELGKKAGKPLAVGQVARLEVGEGIEKKKEDLAAEVAKTLGK